MAKLVRESDAHVVVLTELTPGRAAALDDALAPYSEREVRLGARAYGVGIYSRLNFPLVVDFVVPRS